MGDEVKNFDYFSRSLIFDFLKKSLCSLFAAHNAACLAGESPAPAIDCLAG
jgi:hypothetical protein